MTSLVWRGPWLGIEPGTSRTRSQHYTTRLSRRRYCCSLSWHCNSLTNVKGRLYHTCVCARRWWPLHGEIFSDSFAIMIALTVFESVYGYQMVRPLLCILTQVLRMFEWRCLWKENNLYFILHIHTFIAYVSIKRIRIASIQGWYDLNRGNNHKLHNGLLLV